MFNVYIVTVYVNIITNFQHISLALTFHCIKEKKVYVLLILQHDKRQIILYSFLNVKPQNIKNNFTWMQILAPPQKN